MAGRDRQPWRLGPRGERWFDLVLVGFLLLPAPVYLFTGPGPDSLLVSSLGRNTAIAVVSSAQVLPLVVRRSRPVAAFAAVALASAAQLLVVDLPLWSQLAFPVATYSVARYAAAGWGLAAAGVGLLGAVIAPYVWLPGLGGEADGSAFTAYVLTIAAMVVAAWALGALGRTRQAYVDALVERGERLEREAAQQAQLAAIEERHRIAREMHDVVAHGLTTMVVQADGARAAVGHDPAVAAPAFATIAAAGRDAMTEMRRMLGLLRAEDADTAPQPRLADLPTLLDEARAAGTTVLADLPRPLPEVPDGPGLTAYRVVQEALSNVRKHAGPGATAQVRLAVTDGLLVEVVDDGRGASAARDGSGLGLTGMRERVVAHDGSLAAGPRPGGGFAVCARIPL